MEIWSAKFRSKNFPLSSEPLPVFRHLSRNAKRRSARLSKPEIAPYDHQERNTTNLHALTDAMLAYTNFMDEAEEARSNENSNPDTDKNHKILAYTSLCSLLSHFDMAYKYATRFAEKFEERGCDGYGSNEIAEGYRNLAREASNLIQRADVLQFFVIDDLQKLDTCIRDIPKHEHKTGLEKLNWDFAHVKNKTAPEEGNEEEMSLQEQTSGAAQILLPPESVADIEQTTKAAAETEMYRSTKNLKKQVKNIAKNIEKLNGDISEWTKLANFLKNKLDQAFPGNSQEDIAYFSDAEHYEKYMHYAEESQVQQAEKMELFNSKFTDITKIYQALIDTAGDAKKKKVYEAEKSSAKTR